MHKVTDITSSAALQLAAAEVVRELLGGEIRSSSRIEKGMMTYKCHVQTERGENVMVRFYPESRSRIVNQEPDLLRRCHKTLLPVPEVIGDSRAGPVSPLAYVAYFRIEGDTLNDRLSLLDEVQSTKLAKDLARHLAQQREIVFSGSGELRSGSIAGVDRWPDFVNNCMKLGLEAIHEHSLLPAPLIEMLDRVIRMGPPASYQLTNRLVWGDINYENILVSKHGDIAGLIDFEGCLSGDPLATLGYLQAAHGTTDFYERLLKAWPSALQLRDELMIAWYALLRVARLARYAHQPLPTGRPRDPLIEILPGLVRAIRMLGGTNRL